MTPSTPTPATPTLNQFSFDAAVLSTDLGRVEARLREACTTRHGTVTGVVRHLVDAGGKRVRPLLALGAAAAGSATRPLPDQTIDAAAAIELLHIASLYHDDVLDSASTRRGVPSAHRLWGNHRAILGGDYLLTLAFDSAARLGADGTARLNSTLAEACAAQIDEAMTLFDHRRTPQQYSDCVAGKAASALATACWLGARSVDAGSAATTAVTELGSALGHAGQLIDDLLDLEADEQVIGKPAGSDLREGVYTLPIIFALEDDPGIAALLVDGIDPTAVHEVRERVRATTAYDRCQALVLEHIASAQHCLQEETLTGDGVLIMQEILNTLLKAAPRQAIHNAPGGGVRFRRRPRG
ncbi:polyprenyl synthetase family protein [Actinospica sp.]|jgi:heptaprenyl diphosphate synthase|uniref:polyprenyl synthetase family protein n=1 Tax=Actinospica sp. TaxID=1872142 RepID=UPI002C37EC80|nr:polyprenyl synthetase family protein [Actinospica sp.]HWG26482.1 polyprenyl synthetase family protein [Actinospica sp.]